MKNFRRAMRMDRCRCLHSPLFYLSIVLLWGVWFADQFQDLMLPAGSIPVLFYFRWRQSSQLVAAVPFATSFCEDYRNRFLWYSVQRTNIRAYAWSKVCSTMLYTFLANLLATLSFVAVLLLRSPLVGNGENVVAIAGIAPYGSLLLGESPFLFFVCVAVCESLFMGLLATIALTISCILPDYFVTLTTPIICYYIIIHAIPVGTFSPYRIFMTHSIDMGGPWLSLLYAIGYAMVGMLITGCLFHRLVRRRIIHG